jgi:hypothetical protein
MFMTPCSFNPSRIAGLVLAGLAFLWPHTTQAQVKLEHKFPAGKRLVYKTTENTKQVLTFQGVEQEVEQNEVIVSSETVGQRRGDSTLPIEEKVESARVDFTFPGGINLTVDSKNPDAKVDIPALEFLAEAIKLAAEMKYTVVLDGTNKVTAVEGAEKLVEKADKLSAQARMAIKSQLEPAKLKRDFVQNHHHVPDVLARAGESWERTEVLTIGNGQTITLKKKFEYVGTEKVGDKTLDKIRTKVTGVEFKQDPNAEAQFKVVKSAMKVESSEGTILFDREEGRLVSSDEKTRLKDDMMTFSINGAETPGGIDLTREVKKELQPAPK